MNTPGYSKLFNTLYDETGPVGLLGRGTHYSVLSAAQWADNRRKMLHIPEIQRVAIIWDEDHDTRIIQVIEAAYMRGIFAPVLYIGERKAFLTVVVNDEFYDIIQNDWASYCMAWQDISGETHGDFWNLQLVKVSEAANVMIADDNVKVATYLKNIDNLWGLGCRVYDPPRPAHVSMPAIPTFNKNL